MRVLVFNSRCATYNEGEKKMKHLFFMCKFGFKMWNLCNSCFRIRVVLWCKPTSYFFLRF